MNQEKATKFGYLALMGCPNAGKSTLLNSCLGLKIAGVSAKPQTTRNRIVGLINRDVAQIALLDTPGIQGQPKEGRTGTKLKAEREKTAPEGSDEITRGPSQTPAKPSKLARYMNREAWGAARDADKICYLIDICKGPVAEDAFYVGFLVQNYPGKLIIVLSKADKIPKHERAVVEEKTRAFLDYVVTESEKQVSEKQASERPEPVSDASRESSQIPIIQLSAKQKSEVESFIDRVIYEMPEGPHLYDTETLTDRSIEFVCAELIREQLFRQLGQELPYSTAVKVDRIEEGPKVQHVMATIYVPKTAHKGMVIGKGGQKLKEIGSKSRPPIERFLGDKVFLELFVKVQDGWLDRDGLISELVGASYESASADSADDYFEVGLE